MLLAHRHTWSQHTMQVLRAAHNRSLEVLAEAEARLKEEASAKAAYDLRAQQVMQSSSCMDTLMKTMEESICRACHSLVAIPTLNMTFCNVTSHNAIHKTHPRTNVLTLHKMTLRESRCLLHNLLLHGDEC